jgi:transposase InsO family protein
MDYIGPLNPQSRNGNAYILVGVDYFSRYVITEAVPKATAIGTWTFLRDKVARYFRWPKTTYTDNRSHFRGKDFQEPAKANGIVLLFGPVAALWCTGLAEQTVQLVLAALRRITLRDPEAILD